MAAEGPDAGPDTSLVSLYRWLDTVPLSRPRRNIARDFSDGVLAAEVVKFFFPSLVELHSFVPSCSTAQKVANWGHLNRKVLSKLNLRLPEEMIRELVQSRPGMAEQLLQLLRDKIQERQRQRKGGAGQESEALDEGGYLDTGKKIPKNPPWDLLGSGCPPPRPGVALGTCDRSWRSASGRCSWRGTPSRSVAPRSALTLPLQRPLRSARGGVAWR
ncbi:hypothetical protein HGM15179_017623, partial [Zosterops borbonicus]